MKKILLIPFLIFFLSPNLSFGFTTPFSCQAIGLIYCSASDSCVNSISLCHPTGSGDLSNYGIASCVPDPTCDVYLNCGGGQPLPSPGCRLDDGKGACSNTGSCTSLGRNSNRSCSAACCSASDCPSGQACYNAGGTSARCEAVKTSCTGSVFSNSNDSSNCASSAEAQGRARGLNISCSVVVDKGPSGNLYNPLCSINGGPQQYGAELLAGYNRGSSNINSGWDILNTELSRSTSVSGGTSSSLTASLQSRVSTTTRNIQFDVTNKQISQSKSALLDLYKKLYTDELTSASKFLPGAKNTISNIIAHAQATGSSAVASSTAPLQPTVPDPSVDPKKMSFRYLRVSFNERAWPSMKEVEIYDKSNNKLSLSDRSIISETTPFTFVSAAAPNVDPGRLIDGNYGTIWSPGESNVSCRSSNAFGCPNAIREAYFVIDLGSIKPISLVRLVQGTTAYRNIEVLVSNDNKKFISLTKYNAPFINNQKLDFPKAPLNTTRAPAKIAGKMESIYLNASVNSESYNQILTDLKNEAKNLRFSEKSYTLKLKTYPDKVTNLQYLWKIDGADYVLVDKAVETDPSLGELTEGQKSACLSGLLDKYVFPLHGDYDSGPIFVEGGVVFRPNDSDIGIFDYVTECNAGKRYITTFNAIQVDTDNKTEFKFILELTK